MLLINPKNGGKALVQYNEMGLTNLNVQILNPSLSYHIKPSMHGEIKRGKLDNWHNAYNLLFRVKLLFENAFNNEAIQNLTI